MRIPNEYFVAGAYYHLYNHSAKGQLLFKNASDYEYCHRLMVQHLSPECFCIQAYCLMPNHYHYLIQQLTDVSIPSAFFHIWNKYSKHYNTSHSESGSVFKHKLQHIMVNSNPYFLALVAYIHMNPVKAGIVSEPGDWAWSDYGCWVGEKNCDLFNPTLRDAWFGTPENYRKRIKEISYEKLGIKYLLDE
ncbi:MAG: transposase [Candidatus Cloacimonetes bacterium]|nr:transposase [Candidatus Cloacimonadota bacterium]